MISNIFIVAGLFVACVGLYIYKYKKFNIAYTLFYTHSIEKYSQKNFVKNKNQIAQFIGKYFMISGILFFLLGFVFQIFNISQAYMSIPLLAIVIYNIYNYYHVNKIIKKY